MKKRFLVVGAGLSGLTAGVYLAKEGHDVVILEKTSSSGGLVSSFTKDGFLFDAGPRAFGNAGILTPMLDDLGINLPLVDGKVSTGIEGDIIHHDTENAIARFIDSLHGFFPDEYDSIKKIGALIKRYSKMSKTLNKLPNPYFKNPFSNLQFLFREFIPWLPSFLFSALNVSSPKSIEDVLDSITSNTSLKDMVSQHFFKGTPAPFAFGYFENFRDYKYPIGGIGRLPEALEKKYLSFGGRIFFEREVVEIDPAKRVVRDQFGSQYNFDRLILAGDMKSLYGRIITRDFSNRAKKRFLKERDLFNKASSGESVFTIFAAVSRPPSYFSGISRGHFIYTPKTLGLNQIHRERLRRLKTDFAQLGLDDVLAWVREFCLYNSFEISIPSLKDGGASPDESTGLVISLLLDGEFCRMIEAAGWMDVFVSEMKKGIIDALDGSIYPGLKDNVIFIKTATPLTIMRMFNNNNGAITGWGLDGFIPVPNSIFGIGKAVKTSLPGVYKAGQWSYSPSGVPIAILTGRIAAKKALS